MSKFIKLSLIAVAVIFVRCGHEKPRLDGYFDGLDGCIVVYDESAGQYIRYNQTRAATRYSPCSTFKIPNAVIALETGVIPNSDYVIDWNSNLYPKQNWWTDDPWATWARPHTLKSAIQYSVVWYFKELARKIGEQRYHEYLKIMNYGSQDISGGLTQFWLVSSLKISPDEQVEFLRRFYHNDFDFKQESIDQVKDAIVLEDNDIYRLSGKTGTGMMDNQTMGWLVGYVERDNKVYYYALNIESPDYDRIRSSRLEIVKSVFREMGVIPASGT